MTNLSATDLDVKTLDKIMAAHVDVTGAQHVEVYVSADKTILWVNVNGVRLLRICRIHDLVLEL